MVIQRLPLRTPLYWHYMPSPASWTSLSSFNLKLSATYSNTSSDAHSSRCYEIFPPPRELFSVAACVLLDLLDSCLFAPSGAQPHVARLHPTYICPLLDGCADWETVSFSRKISS